MDADMPQHTRPRDAPSVAARALHPVPHDLSTERSGCEAWLLNTHPTPSMAQREWDDYGVALLPLGTQFAAVRIPREVVLSAIRLETAHNGTLDRFLAQVMGDGPVICDQHEQRYYALVPSNTAAVWHKAATDWSRVGVEILGRDTHLGVPRLDLEFRLPYTSLSYWSVPMKRPGELCDPIAVARLMAFAVPTLSSADAT